MADSLNNVLTVVLNKDKADESFGFSLRRAADDSGTVAMVSDNLSTLHQVIRVEKDGHAYNASLRDGDRILEINDHDVRSKSYKECVQLLRISGMTLKLKVISSVQKRTNTISVVQSNSIPIRQSRIQTQVEIQIDIPEYLQTDRCMYSTTIEENNESIRRCFEVLRPYCSSPEGPLDTILNIIVDEPLSTELIVERIAQEESLANILTPYVVDSLKRYHGLRDVVNVLSEVFESQISGETKRKFEILDDQLTKRFLLVQALENVSHDTQRFLGNFIQRNDLPIPFSYKIWNFEENAMQYRVNFNSIMEPLCLCDLRLMLQFGSPLARGLGKTSLIGYWFDDKRQESLFTDMADSDWRDGSIDVIFAEQFVIFDMHGETTDMKSMRSIQPYVDLQVIYVTEQDFGGDFLKQIVSKSKSDSDKIVVVFNSKYDDLNESAKLIKRFQDKYQHWENVQWTSAPIINIRSSLSSQKIMKRNKRLRESFKQLLSPMKLQARKNLFQSSFQIQSSFHSVEDDPTPVQTTFEVEKEFHQLFSNLSDQTMNLRIVTPANYQRSEKNFNDSTTSKRPTENYPRNSELVGNMQMTTVSSTLNDYHKFTITLLTRRTYIELLMVERHLENWRNAYLPKLRLKHESVRENASTLLRQFKKAEMENPRSSETALSRENYELARSRLRQLDEQMMNVDLTFGLLCDELFAVWDLIVNTHSVDTISKWTKDFELVAAKLVELVNKGFALHILRGRPLQSHSRLLQMCMEKLQFRDFTGILTVIGEQSSAKSSLLNATFGCNFHVSAGRCTIGVYLGLVHYKNMTIVILDTEGLLSLEESGSIFDNQIVTMAVLSSNLVIINHKGEISSNLEGLIGMSLYAKIQIQSSPFKPKLLFALRDQARRDVTTIFQQQLNRLKDNIQTNGQFLKMSIEDELEMRQIALLPSAYTEDENPDYNIIQKWRTETFAAEIIKFRSTTIKALEEYMNEASSLLPEENFQRVANTSRNLTKKFGRYLYAKLTTSWKSIDDLGERLLTCQSLYELSIQNELKSLATNIITEQQDSLQQSGSDLIQKVVQQHNKQNQMHSRKDNEDLKPHILVRQCMENGTIRLKELVDSHVERADIDYQEVSKQSVFSRMKSQWSFIEGSIRNMQLYLNEQLEMYAWETILKARHDYYRHELMSIKEKCVSSNALSQQLNQRVVELEADITNSLQEYQRSKADISKTVLDVYKNLIQTKSLKRRRTNISVCKSISYDNYREDTKELSEIMNHYLNRFAEPAGIFNSIPNSNTTMSFLGKTNTTSSPVTLINQQILLWFPQNRDQTKIHEAIKFVYHDLLNRINNKLNTLPLHLAYSDPRNLDQIIEIIDYELQIAKLDMREINRPAFIQSIMMLMIYTLVEKTDKKFEERQSELLNETLKDLRRVQQNVVDQMRHEEDLVNQAQIFRRILGRTIISEVLRNYRRKFLEQWNSKTFRNLGIDPTILTRKIYRESILSQTIDPNSILRLVYDPNHYCAEKVLKTLRTAREQLVEFYLNDARNQITGCMLIMTDTVLNNECKDAYVLCSQIGEQVVTFFPDFRGPNTIEVEKTIRNPQEFKKYFKKADLIDGEQDAVLEEELKKIPDELMELLGKVSETNMYQTIGCDCRCPGCGIKCELPAKSGVEEDHQHSSQYHLPMAFAGWPCNEEMYPHLSMCYQQWKKKILYRGDGSFSTPEQFFLNEAPDWYDDVKEKSETGEAQAEIYPPVEQRRAWMAIRSKLLSEFELQDQGRYHSGVYPTHIISVPVDYELLWDSM